MSSVVQDVLAGVGSVCPKDKEQHYVGGDNYWKLLKIVGD